MKKRVRFDRETRFRVRTPVGVWPFLTPDIVCSWRQKTSHTRHRGHEKASKPRGVGQFRQDATSVPNRYNPNSALPANAQNSVANASAATGYADAITDDGGDFPRQKEVAAVVKLLPSLTQRLVVMQIWQADRVSASGMPRPGSTPKRRYRFPQ